MVGDWPAPRSRCGPRPWTWEPLATHRAPHVTAHESQQVPATAGGRAGTWTDAGRCRVTGRKAPASGRKGTLGGVGLGEKALGQRRTRGSALARGLQDAPALPVPPIDAPTSRRLPSGAESVLGGASGRALRHPHAATRHPGRRPLLPASAVTAPVPGARQASRATPGPAQGSAPDTCVCERARELQLLSQPQPAGVVAARPALALGLGHGEDVRGF